MAGMLPENVGALCANTNNFRDALVHQILASGDPSPALKTLINRLNNLQIVDDKDDAAICEVVATLAYGLGDLELTKETMLRIPPHLGTDYIKTVYRTFAEYKWEPKRFADILTSSGPQALERWNQEKATI
jgi:hypothetical protein